MPPTAIPFANAEEVCREVRKLPGCEEWLTIRPFNPYRPDETSWWLVPTTDLPAYGTGKFWFRSSDQRGVLVGLKMEKGWGPETSALGVKPARIMRRSWIWHSLARDITSGRFLQALQELRSSDQIQVRLSLAGPEQDDDWHSRLPRDDFKWRWDPNNQRLVLLESNTPGEYVPGVDSVDSLPRLATVLTDLLSSPTVWADLFVLTEFHLTGAATALERRQAAETIYADYLKPFAHWVRRLETSGGER